MPNGLPAAPLTSFRAERLASDRKSDGPGNSTQTNAAKGTSGSDTPRASHSGNSILFFHMKISIP